MWQAFESSIQTFNRARRMNLSMKKNPSKPQKMSTPLCLLVSFVPKFRTLISASVLDSTPAAPPVYRPNCSIAELMRKTNFSKDEIRHLYRTFKQVEWLRRIRRLASTAPTDRSRIVHRVKWAKVILHRFWARCFLAEVGNLLSADDIEWVTLHCRMLPLCSVSFPKHRSMQHGLHPIRRHSQYAFDSRSWLDRRSIGLDLRLVRLEQRWQINKSSWETSDTCLSCSEWHACSTRN